MARFRTYGALDDPHATDGDTSFVRMVTRVNPEQLQSGDLAYSQNGRMDNDRTWQPRKGLSVWSKPLDLSASVPQLDDNGTPLQLPFDLNDAGVNAVYGSTEFVDPVNGNRYVIIATNAKLLAIEADDNNATAYTVKYPNSGTLSEDVEIVQALDSLLLFRGGLNAWKFRKGLAVGSSWLLSASRTSNVVTIQTNEAHGLTTGDIVQVAGISYIGDNPNGDFEVTVTSDTTFTYSNTGVDDFFPITTTIESVYPVMEAVSTVASATTTDTGTDNAEVADGVVTVTTAFAHGRSSGDLLTIYYAGDSGLIDGDRYEIVLGDIDGNDETTKYHFNAEIDDGTYTIALGGKAPLGGGYIAMPDPAWGIYHENRLIVPYARALDSGTTDDEIVFSDIFDYETFDPIRNQFRMGGGSGDKLVGLSPLLDDRLLVFCRRSIHLITGVSGSLSDSSRTELTREVGCIARKSIVEVGGQVLWLSDQGIYSVAYGGELNLIANAMPLSEPIENQVRQINWAYASNAVGSYVDNRYFLAVPMGSSTVNNTVLVYNFLNQGWESIDTFPDGFNITNMLILPVDGKNTLFLVNSSGAVHLTEQNLGSDSYQNDAGGGTQQTEIYAYAKTRRYTFGTFDIKRFSRASTITTGIYGEGLLDVYILTTDPNSTRKIESANIGDEEDYNLRSRIGMRGYGAQLQFETSTAKIRGCTLDAIISSRANTDRS
jgi:hypothetical protein